MQLSRTSISTVVVGEQCCHRVIHLRMYDPHWNKQLDYSILIRQQTNFSWQLSTTFLRNIAVFQLVFFLGKPVSWMFHQLHLECASEFRLSRAVWTSWILEYMPQSRSCLAYPQASVRKELSILYCICNKHKLFIFCFKPFSTTFKEID